MRRVYEACVAMPAVYEVCVYEACVYEACVYEGEAALGHCHWSMHRFDCEQNFRSDCNVSSPGVEFWSSAQPSDCEIPNMAFLGLNVTIDQ